MRWTLWLLAVLGIAQFAFVAYAHPTAPSADIAYLVMALCMIALLVGLAFPYCGGCWDQGCGCGHCNECRDGCCGACGCGGCACDHCDGCRTDACCGKCDCVAAEPATPAPKQAA